MMILVNAFIFWSLKNRQRSRGWCYYWGPFVFTMMAAPLIMADLMRHVLQDQGVWKECNRPNGLVWDSTCNSSSSQYKCTLPGPDHCIPDNMENLGHLSPMGILFTICFTYIGFAFLFVGVLWNANIVKKCGEIRDQWNEIRGRRVDPKSPSIQDEGAVGV